MILINIFQAHGIQVGLVFRKYLVSRVRALCQVLSAKDNAC